MCDCLCALPVATDGHTTLFAKNSDRPPTEPQQVEWFAPRRETETRTTYLTIAGAADSETVGFVGSRPTWMWGVEHGVNEAGVAAGNATIYTRLDPRGVEPGLPGMDLVRLALERATTATAAVATIVDLLVQHGQGGSGHRDADRPYWSSFLVADPTGAFVVETSGREYEVESVDCTRAISNRTTIPTFDAIHRHPQQPVGRLVDPRLVASHNVLAAEPVTVAALKQHLRSHRGDDGWTVCMHVDDPPEATTAAMVAELRAGSRPIAHVAMGSPCRSIFVPVVVGQPFGDAPAWEAFRALRAENRARLDAVEAALTSQVSDHCRVNVTTWERVVAALAAERV